MLPDATLNHFAATCACDKALLEGGVSAEGGVGATLDNRLEPIYLPVVFGSIASSEEPDFGEIRDLSSVACLSLLPDRQLGVISKSFAEHTFEVLVGLVDAPRAEVRRDPLINSRNLPLEV